MSAWLSPAGIGSALAVGLAVLAGTGWRGVVLLFVFLVSSSLMTPGGGGRRPIQVYANGGVAAVCALLAHWHPAFVPAMAGAIAAAACDTWSTEIGGRSRRSPRMITTWRQVEPGVSGGVTWLGSLGALGGAVTIALAARLVGLVTTPQADWIAAAGCAGGLADSLLGATLQVRWRCPSCHRVIERPIHGCGVLAIRHGGWRWITNDTVNFVATLTGAVVAALPAILGRAGLA